MNAASSPRRCWFSFWAATTSRTSAVSNSTVCVKASCLSVSLPSRSSVVMTRLYLTPRPAHRILQIKRPHQPQQIVRMNSEQLRGALIVAPGLPVGLQNRVALGVHYGALVSPRKLRRLRRFENGFGQILRQNLAAGPEHHGALHVVLQLAHVPGPVICAETTFGLR